VRISDEQVDHWLRHGYVVIPGFLTPQELAAARQNIARYLPTAEEYAAAAERYANLETGINFPAAPFVGDALNGIMTHPEIIAFVERALGTPEIALVQTGLAAKYGGRPDEDQDLHLDYLNNDLLYPRDDGAFRQIPMILYYSDVTTETSPTYVVSQQHTGDEFLYPTHRTRQEHPHLYAHEQPMVCPAGSLLIYSMRTFHRGSAFRASSGARFVQFLVYAHAAYRWMGMNGWSTHGYLPTMRRLMETATVAQRGLLGVPPPGHPYWTAETLGGVAARYPGMDMAPYRQATSA